MDLGLRKKNVLITGSSKNIGKSIAIAMAKEGANLIICARDEAKLNEILVSTKQFTGIHSSFPVDLQNKNGPSNLLKHIKNNNFFPDIIIHNLGGSLQITQENFSRYDLEKVWQFNLGISHEINQKLIPNMVKKKWGRIIHISSLAAKTGKGYIPYVSSKSALEGYIKSMSKILSKKKIIMTGIAPGLVELPNRYFTKLKEENPEKLKKYFNEHLPIGRMVQPDEIADLVCFLCSNRNNYMAGSIIPIDGGGS